MWNEQRYLDSCERCSKEDTRREARVAMMEANKNALQSMYTVDDNLMTVFVFESGIATIYSFTEEPKVINL